jgi:hypothetical protein
MLTDKCINFNKCLFQLKTTINNSPLTKSINENYLKVRLIPGKTPLEYFRSDENFKDVYKGNVRSIIAMETAARKDIFSAITA